MDLTNETFSQALDSNDILLVDFWADWCGPCLKVAPILEEIANEFDIQIGKVHVDQQIKLAEQYEVSTIPTLIMFEKGVPVKKVIGAHPKHKLVKEFEGWL